MENSNVDQVFKEYGLEVEQVEPYVYRVLNTEKEVSVEELQDSLASCILLTSERTGRKRLGTGGYYTLAKITGRGLRGCLHGGEARIYGLHVIYTL